MLFYAFSGTFIMAVGSTIVDTPYSQMAMPLFIAGAGLIFSYVVGSHIGVFDDE